MHGWVENVCRKQAKVNLQKKSTFSQKVNHYLQLVIRSSGLRTSATTMVNRTMWQRLRKMVPLYCCWSWKSDVEQECGETLKEPEKKWKHKENKILKTNQFILEIIFGFYSYSHCTPWSVLSIHLSAFVLLHISPVFKLGPSDVL